MESYSSDGEEFSRQGGVLQKERSSFHMERSS